MYTEVIYLLSLGAMWHGLSLCLTYVPCGLGLGITLVSPSLGGLSLAKINLGQFRFKQHLTKLKKIPRFNKILLKF
jgi:hypothetical protein